jgi:hypothetical protein
VEEGLTLSMAAQYAERALTHIRIERKFLAFSYISLVFEKSYPSAHLVLDVPESDYDERHCELCSQFER